MVPSQAWVPSLTVLWMIVVIAAVWDAWQRRIPNGLILVGLLLGAAFQVQAAGLDGLWASLGGAAVALLVLIGPFAMRIMGGGDVKLAMVCGAFTGWSAVLQIILLGTAVHGVVALVFIFARLVAKSRGRDLASASKVPHAVGFGVSTVLVTAGLVTLW
ncbi:A24 family peptidase [Myxococcota bacterium]|nr:A24 family peptidase [Myxococcota bacterium]